MPKTKPQIHELDPTSKRQIDELDPVSKGQDSAPKRQKVQTETEKLKERGLVNRTGINQKGLHTDNVNVRLPRGRKRDEGELHHLAHAFRAATAGCVEVQVLKVNDRFVVATNKYVEASTIFLEIDKSQRENKGAKEVMQQYAKRLEGDNDTVLVRHVKKLMRRIGSGEYKLLQTALSRPIHSSSMEELPQFLTHTRYKNSMTFLTGSSAKRVPESHAEQKLAYALWHHGISGQAMIIGSKRPCCFCHATLTFMRKKLRVDIAKTSPPGLAWGGPGEFLRFIAKKAVESSEIDDGCLEGFLEWYMAKYTSHVSGLKGAPPNTDDPHAPEFRTDTLSMSMSE